MPEVTFHALRHTHASQLIDAGVDIVTISKRLGHAKPDITLRVYAHLFARTTARRLRPSMRLSDANGCKPVANSSFVFSAPGLNI